MTVAAIHREHISLSLTQLQPGGVASFMHRFLPQPLNEEKQTVTKTKQLQPKKESPPSPITAQGLHHEEHNTHLSCWKNSNSWEEGP